MTDSTHQVLSDTLLKVRGEDPANTRTEGRYRGAEYESHPYRPSAICFGVGHS